MIIDVVKQIQGGFLGLTAHQLKSHREASAPLVATGGMSGNGQIASRRGGSG